MAQDLITIIVPVYNVAQYLDFCVSSIACQNYTNLEIILSDDGSTDASGVICDEWTARDPRIQVIHKANGGLSDARNAGIQAAKGKYYMFVDGDDTIAPDTVERLYRAILHCGCQIAVCNIIRTYEDGRSEPFYCPAQHLTVLSGLNRFDTLNQPSVCNKLFLAELFQELRFPLGKHYEDTFIYHILAHRASAIALTGHDGYYYLLREGSILAQSSNTDRYFDYIEAVNARMTYLLAHNIPGYAERACLSVYVATAKAEKFVPKTAKNREKFRKMRQFYCTAYSYLMRHPNTGSKQKLRLVLLRYVPRLHTLLYGR